MADNSPITHARFWSKAKVGSDNECWLWHGYRSAGGYGRFKLNGNVVNANRVAYTLVFGSIPDGHVIRHKCDNPACVNPAHLQSGTHADNVADKISRGRGRNGSLKGEKNPRAKLTEADVSAIKRRIADGEGNGPISDDYPVGDAMISKIRQGEAWGWVGASGGDRTPDQLGVNQLLYR